jgi:hypothetical protein
MGDRAIGCSASSLHNHAPTGEANPDTASQESHPVYEDRVPMFCHGQVGTIKLLSLVDSLSTRLSFQWFSMGFACESHQSYFVIRGENSIGVLTKLVSQ